MDGQDQSASLSELYMMMQEYAPVIPDAVTDFYLAKAGFQSDDVQLKRLLGLAAQKFVADIAADAFAYSKLKTKEKTKKDAKKHVLTMEDLSAALADQGVNIKKPEYYS